MTTIQELYDARDTLTARVAELESENAELIRDNARLVDLATEAACAPQPVSLEELQDRVNEPMTASNNARAKQD